MRAAAFIRYHSGQGFGHVGWAFHFDPPNANAGSVENHSGHWFTPATKMGFWSKLCTNPVVHMREREYDDVKYIDIPNGDPILAYRTVLWIRENAYRAWFRNCEDDVYDVLRAYGVENLTPPSLVWFPKSWFKRFRGTLQHVADFKWDGEVGHREITDDDELARRLKGLQPWHPTWRRPLHLDFQLLNIGILFRRPAEVIRQRLWRR